MTKNYHQYLEPSYACVWRSSVKVDTNEIRPTFVYLTIPVHKADQRRHMSQFVIFSIKEPKFGCWPCRSVENDQAYKVHFVNHNETLYNSGGGVGRNLWYMTKLSVIFTPVTIYNTFNWFSKTLFGPIILGQSKLLSQLSNLETEIAKDEGKRWFKC